MNYARYPNETLEFYASVENKTGKELLKTKLLFKTLTIRRLNASKSFTRFEKNMYK